MKVGNEGDSVSLGELRGDERVVLRRNDLHIDGTVNEEQGAENKTRQSKLREPALFSKEGQRKQIGRSVRQQDSVNRRE